MIGEGGGRGGGVCVLARKREVSGLGGGQEVSRWLELRIQSVRLLALLVEWRVELGMLILLLLLLVLLL